MNLLGSKLTLAFEVRTRGIRTKFIFGDSLADNEFGPAIYVDFLPKALAQDRYIAAPNRLSPGEISTPYSRPSISREKGVSAKKV